jgi:hypothetical protein
MTEVTVVAFDPGETTGWAAMTVKTEWLLDVNRYPSLNILAACPEGRDWWTWGQIDSRHLGSLAGGVGVGRGHDALNFVGENTAVDKMCELVLHTHPESAVLLEKFVVDPSKVKGNFDFVSPIRIISAFSYALHADAMDKAFFQVEVKRDPYNRFYLINRGDPKRTCHDERMKQWGFKAVVSHATRHACDASRIAFYHLRSCRGNSIQAQEARFKAWPHVFPDPQYRRVPEKPKRPQPLGERI